jgi:uncharacterized repeat protein (TIGR02543 family)
VIPPATYTVTFNSQDGTSVPSQTVNYGEKATEPNPVPTKENYLFDGWFKESSCVNVWNFNVDVVNSDITLYAKWTPTTGIEDKEVSPLKIYPNPTTDNITIILPEDMDEAVVKLYDMQGRLLIIKRISHQDFISVSHFPSGLYIYNIKMEENEIKGKIVKQ